MRTRVGQALGRYARSARNWLSRKAQQFRDWRERGRERRRRQREERERRKLDRLERIVRTLSPQLESLLRRGIGRGLLWLRLRMWQVRYLLTSLRMTPEGGFSATLNPTRPLTVRGRRISDAELGTMLMPILRAAEEAYEAQVRLDPAANDRLARASAAELQGAENSLRGLSRFEQQMILRSITPPPGRRTVEPSVDIGRPGPGRGKVENIYRYAADPEAGTPGMVSSLLATGRRYGVTRRDIENVMTTHPAALDAALNALMGKMITMGKGTTKRDRERQAVLTNNLRRASFLHQAFEPARRAGIPTTTAVSSVMLRSGAIQVQDVMGARGALAPMTPVGAAPETDRPLTAEQRRAEALRQRRVGRVFSVLLSEGRKANIFVSQGGYDLSALASAIRTWLNAATRARPDPADLERATLLLQEELVLLLTSYHGER
jgi:hypothetical protein